MGRRSRQRASAPSSEPSRTRTAPRRASRRDDAPQPPWGSFPLIELAALGAIGCAVVGLVQGGRTGGVLLTVAMLLGSVAGLEVAIREHLAGYRSHTLLLSGVLAVATLAVLFFANAGRTVMVPAAAAVFATAFVAKRQLFKARSGGAGVKVR
ncbi:MAG TPA: hypothetical protein VLC53_19545 [Myxococcota bacterium]|nr:hypothetical protein [Myxococcota bacterium]